MSNDLLSEGDIVYLVVSKDIVPDGFLELKLKLVELYYKY